MCLQVFRMMFRAAVNSNFLEEKERDEPAVHAGMYGWLPEDI